MSSCKLPACLTSIFLQLICLNQDPNKIFTLYLVDVTTVSHSREVPINLLSCYFFAEETRPVFLHCLPRAGFGQWHSWGVFEHVPLSFAFLTNWHLDGKPHALDFLMLPPSPPRCGGGDIYPKADERWLFLSWHLGPSPPPNLRFGGKAHFLHWACFS